MADPRDLLDGAQALPGVPDLIGALKGLPPTYLVGGAVRDLLLKRPPIDLDIAVEGDGPATARELALRLGGRATIHERFGTATIESPRVSFDLAATRRERYPQPGALPEVEPAGLEEDLARRDFTVNAMAVALSGDRPGELHAFPGAQADLGTGTIRVLHDRSFHDDPTRLLRAFRYGARLEFALDPHTEDLAVQAAAAGAPATVSGARVRDELLDLLAEPRAPTAISALRDLGVAAALHPALRADPDLVAGAALSSAQTGADPGFAGLAALLSAAPDELGGFVAQLALTGDRYATTLRAARRGSALAEALREELRPSDLYALLAPEPPEALALALAMGAPGEPVLRFLSELCGVGLEITGDDLLAAGVPGSSALGRALDETLRRKLDGEVRGREEELALAVGLARAGA